MTNPPNTNGLRIAKVSGLFSALVAALYAMSDAEPSPIVVSFLWLAPGITVIMWLQRDAYRTGVGAVHDLGLFLWLAWPIVIPWYSWKTRGWSGWRLCLGLFALLGSPYLGWFVAACVIYALRSSRPG